MDIKIANKTIRLSFFVSCFLLTGCVAITAHGNFEKVESFPDLSQFSYKPSVHLTLGVYRENFDRFKDAVVRATDQAGLFGSFTFDLDEDQQVDYTIHLVLTSEEEEINPVRAFGSVIVTAVGCLTPYGVPYPVADWSYTLTASVMAHPSIVLRSYDVQESVTVWCGLSLIPFAPFTLEGDKRLWAEMVKTLYKKIIDDQLLVYSSSNSPGNGVRHEE